MMEDRWNEIEQKVAELLEVLGVNLDDPNFQETPHRVAEYFGIHFNSDWEVKIQLEEMKTKVFPSLYDGIVTVGTTRAFGVCPHHLLPVVYDITAAYIPDGLTIGLSKLCRVPKLVALKPRLQEDITVEIASTLRYLLGTNDIAVLVEGQHQCMQVRGVEEEAITTTSTMWGRFTEDVGGCKAEFFRIVDRNRRK